MATNSMSVVLYEVKDHIATITMNRPEKRNAINHEMREGLFNAFQSANEDDNVWVIILTGAGGHFSTGHDLVEMGEIKPRPGRSTDDLYLYQREVFKPIISAVQGYCLAQGGGLNLGSDIRIAGESAKFGWPQVKRGIMSISGPGILAHSIPLAAAMELLFTGDFIDAREAYRLGMVNRVVRDDAVMDAARDLASRICSNAPLAVRGMKEATMRGLSLSLRDSVRLAADVLNRVNQSEDAKEGLRAFAEKRQPVWTGR